MAAVFPTIVGAALVRAATISGCTLVHAEGSCGGLPSFLRLMRSATGAAVVAVESVDLGRCARRWASERERAPAVWYCCGRERVTVSLRVVVG